MLVRCSRHQRTNDPSGHILASRKTFGSWHSHDRRKLAYVSVALTSSTVGRRCSTLSRWSASSSHLSPGSSRETKMRAERLLLSLIYFTTSYILFLLFLLQYDTPSLLKIWCQHMISYRKYVIQKEALESNHTGVISLFP